MLSHDYFENNLNTIIANTKIEWGQLYSSCVYNNIDNRRQNLILKLLSAINNIKLKTMPT